MNTSVANTQRFVDRNLGPVARTAHADASDVHVSYEFFPPKSEAMEERLWECVRKLERLGPDFVSVTYGAGGSTRKRTHRTVTRMAAETSLRPAAHLTCVGSSRDEIKQIAEDYWTSGVRHIVALRGDPPAGIDQSYKPAGDGFSYSSDLVAGLKEYHDFEISVSAYPERHPESPSWDTEIDNLKRKIDAGASRAITQFFFSPDTFMRFQDRVLDAGINIPIVPGLMLQPNFSGLRRMAKMCGVTVPEWYEDLFEGLDDDVDTRQLLTASLASELTAELHDRGVRHFHLYTLNRAELAYAVSRVLGLHNRMRTP
ncbi:methylenetetrahydrofolate reductase [NAD(P)H] [Robiginitomaculum antarcticum]|uniref:methylenetetrahydrofolate reductase [NAD(P)H] n=1 Tax=Robiginitomaculum antarcticum TaxID=437507 RepID=UPI0003608112|nr:methylenetetrahydrofolate reductase [NAD(P)H] [Robiginitomaculum antarcticum]